MKLFRNRKDNKLYAEHGVKETTDIKAGDEIVVSLLDKIHFTQHPSITSVTDSSILDIEIPIFNVPYDLLYLPDYHYLQENIVKIIDNNINKILTYIKLGIKNIDGTNCLYFKVDEKMEEYFKTLNPTTLSFTLGTLGNKDSISIDGYENKVWESKITKLLFITFDIPKDMDVFKINNLLSEMSTAVDMLFSNSITNSAILESLKDEDFELYIKLSEVYKKTNYIKNSFIRYGDMDRTLNEISFINNTMLNILSKYEDIPEKLFKLLKIDATKGKYSEAMISIFK